MKVLVAVASRHGSTREIAAAIAAELQAAGIDGDLCEAGQVPQLDGYDAVVLGSAVYMGNWLQEAREFVERYRDDLAAMPLWLFSSGPLGSTNPQPAGDPERLGDLLRSVPHRDHCVFVGRLDKHTLGLRERLAVKAVHAPEGDFRDWSAVRTWARTIADAVAAPQRA